MTLRGSRVRILRNHLHHRFHQRRVLLRREKHGPHESPRSLNAGIEAVRPGGGGRAGRGHIVASCDGVKWFASDVAHAVSGCPLRGVPVLAAL